MERINYEISYCKGSYISDIKGNNSFNTEQEAIEVATEFKNNPRSHNPLMSDESVNYWKSQNYTIFKKTVIIEEICCI